MKQMLQQLLAKPLDRQIVCVSYAAADEKLIEAASRIKAALIN